MKRIKIWNIITPVLIIVITIIAIQFSQGWRYNVTEKTIVPTGILDVTSDPRGATIYLDGEELGKSPKVISSVSAGDHLLELRKDTHINWQAQVNVESGQATKIEANLFEEDTQLEQISDTPIENIFFAKNGNEAIIISKHKDNQGIWKVQLKTSFFAIEKTKVKIANLYEPGLFDLLQTQEYQMSPSPDFNKILLSVAYDEGSTPQRTFIIDSNKSEIIEVTEYVSHNKVIKWSDDSTYLLYQTENALFSLHVNDLKVSQVTNALGNETWTTISDQMFFVVEDIITREQSLTSARLDGTDREILELGGINSSDITRLFSNPIHESLIISTIHQTYLYEIPGKELEIIAEYELTPFSVSPNQRFTLLQNAGTSDIWTYDHETDELSVAIEGYQYDTNLLVWAPNDLKLFYRITNEENENIVKSLDANGNNKLDVLTLKDYSASLDTKIGLSTDAKELYLPLLSNVIVTNDSSTETDEEEQTTPVESNEIIIYKLKLR